MYLQSEEVEITPRDLEWNFQHIEMFMFYLCIRIAHLKRHGIVKSLAIKENHFTSIFASLKQFSHFHKLIIGGSCVALKLFI